MEKPLNLLTPSQAQAALEGDHTLKQLSGRSWVSEFPTSTRLDDLSPAFGSSAHSFISALQAAGASVNIAATLRPAQRAFLMHWAWKIVNADADPKTIPTRDGVNIEWSHVDEKGEFCSERSIVAAREMVDAYGLKKLRVAPALRSRHIEGNAIDMAISWTGTLSITDALGSTIHITTAPRTGMNTDLHAVAITYGVIKFKGGDKDIPHWSTDGC
ncbi:peptidoglycan-binding domain-containing protein [Pseudomonas sp. p50(2008)]|uniref:peptidoglycan-binding domain-containing protein n=1 Tax=Pseudomonas sp. p50(2008) TaxID=2816832 RepID=UPI001F3107FB|nr:peptidoglycan-binding domain-containing protein [Pseudomonas sp. p50(2008)]